MTGLSDAEGPQRTCWWIPLPPPNACLMATALLGPQEKGTHRLRGSQNHGDIPRLVMWVHLCPLLISGLLAGPCKLDWQRQIKETQSEVY